MKLLWVSLRLILVIAPLQAAQAGFVPAVSVLLLPGSATGLMGMESVGISPARGELTVEEGLKLKLDDQADRLGFSVGPGRVIPDMKVTLRHDDNLTLEPSNEISTFVTILSPHAAYVVSDKTRKFVLDYLMEAGFHEASSVDDYVDNRLRASYDWQPTSRISTSLTTEFLDSHDPRGTARARAGAGIIQNSPDEWHHLGATGRFGYGARTARGRIELESGYLTKTYDNNREFTFTRDREETYGQGAFFYRWRPKTHFLIESRITDYNYQRDPIGEPSLDGLTSQFLAGVTWEATFKTTGFAKFGYVMKTFASSQRETGDGLAWQVGLDWKPRSYSTVHFETVQNIEETDGTGDLVKQLYALLSWEHFWKERFSTRVETLYQNQAFDPTFREDDLFQAGITANYVFRRWMTLGAGYRHETLSSNDERFEYDQNIFEITVDLVF